MRGPNDNKVLEMRNKYPCATLEYIGDQVGLSRERVRQLLKRAGADTRPRRIPKHSYVCSDCGRIYRSRGTKIESYRIYCSACRSARRAVILICDNCSKEFPRERADVINKATDPRYKGNQFCSKNCFYSYGKDKS